MPYEIETGFPSWTYAKDRAAGASQFRVKVIADYQANYENFWCLGVPEVGRDEMQAILDTMGLAGLAVLSDACAYVQGLVTAFPGDLPAKYHAAPYTYTVSEFGEIMLGELKEAWQPEDAEDGEG